MMDFISKQGISVVEEQIEQRFAESQARTPRLCGKFKHLDHLNGFVIKVRDLQCTNFYERFKKDEDNEREMFMNELKTEHEQWNNPDVYLKNMPRLTRKFSLELQRGKQQKEQEPETRPTNTTSLNTSITDSIIMKSGSQKALPQPKKVSKATAPPQKEQ